METLINFAGRLLLAHIFVISGLIKISGFAATQAYMSSKGVPGALLPLAILLEVGGGFAIITGFMTRWVSFALALFCVVSGLLFHLDLGDQSQNIHLMKNLAMAGGFLILAQTGTPFWSVDAMLAFRAVEKNGVKIG